MQYHAHALAASGVDVSVIGYQGAPLPKFLTDNPRISIHRFYEPRFRWRIGRSKLITRDWPTRTLIGIASLTLVLNDAS